MHDCLGSGLLAGPYACSLRQGYQAGLTTKLSCCLCQPVLCSVVPFCSCLQLLLSAAGQLCCTALNTPPWSCLQELEPGIVCLDFGTDQQQQATRSVPPATATVQPSIELNTSIHESSADAAPRCVTSDQASASQHNHAVLTTQHSGMHKTMPIVHAVLHKHGWQDSVLRDLRQYARAAELVTPSGADEESRTSVLDQAAAARLANSWHQPVANDVNAAWQHNKIQATQRKPAYDGQHCNGTTFAQAAKQVSSGDA